MAMVQPHNLHRRLWAARLAMWLFLLITLSPLVMLILASLESGNMATDSLIPRHITLEHWYLALGIPWEQADGTVIAPSFPVLVWLWNSVKVATISSTLIVTFTITGAYTCARLRLPGKRALLALMIILPLFPPVLSLTGIYSLFDQLGYYASWLGLDSLWSLTLAHLGGVLLPFWLLKGYLATIDKSPEEAACIAGANTWQTLRYILLPTSIPILVTAFTLAFIASITEFPAASVLLNSTDKLTLTVGLRRYLQLDPLPWRDFAAAAILCGLPITVVFLVGQRWLVAGQRVIGLRD